MTDLGTDIQMLRSLRVPQKWAVIQWTAHMIIQHPEAFKGLDEKDVKDLVYSRTPAHELAKILETSPPNMKGEVVSKHTEGRNRPTTAGRGRGKPGATNARRSSRPTEQQKKRSSRKSRGSNHEKRAE